LLSSHLKNADTDTEVGVGRGVEDKKANFNKAGKQSMICFVSVSLRHHVSYPKLLKVFDEIWYLRVNIILIPNPQTTPTT